MVSPAAHSFTCEVVHASVAGVHWHSCTSFANLHVCGACTEPVCYASLAGVDLAPSFGALQRKWPDAAGGARAPVLVMALVACLVPHQVHWCGIALCSVACLRSWGLVHAAQLCYGEAGKDLQLASRAGQAAMVWKCKPDWRCSVLQLGALVRDVSCCRAAGIMDSAFLFRLQGVIGESRSVHLVRSSYQVSLDRAAPAGPVVHAVSAAPEVFVCPLKSLAVRALTAGYDALKQLALTAAYTLLMDRSPRCGDYILVLLF